jgi:hypothetical protein
MAKRWLYSIPLLLILSVLIVVYVLATSSQRTELLYTPEQQRAFAVHSRLNLSQAPPLSNVFVDGALVESGGLSNLGATECRVRATLDARYEDVEGVTTTVYDLDFEGSYRLRFSGPSPTGTVEIVFPFPAGLDTLNQVYFLVDGNEPADVQYNLSNITWRTEMAAGEERGIVVRYRARGVGSFTYALDRDRRLESLDVVIVVQGLEGSEVPDDTLAATVITDVEGGERFAWQYEALIADRNVRVELPARPGFAQRVEKLQKPLRDLSLVSPLLVACFVGCLAGVHYLTAVQLPFQHYLLAGLGFFLFYPALTFLSGVFELTLAAGLASVVITGVLVAFLGFAAGWQRTWWSTLLLSVAFLGSFSMGAMSQWRGLLFTAGGLLLVGAFMLLLARRQAAGAKSRVPSLKDVQDSVSEDELEVGSEKQLCSVRRCPHCGAELDAAFAFCPACGHDTSGFRVCPECGCEHYAPPESEMRHCPACGEKMGE